MIEKYKYIFINSLGMDKVYVISGRNISVQFNFCSISLLKSFANVKKISMLRE